MYADSALAVTVFSVVYLSVAVGIVLAMTGTAAHMIGLDGPRQLRTVAWMNGVTGPAFVITLSVAVLAAGRGQPAVRAWAVSGAAILIVLIAHAVMLRWVLDLGPGAATARSLALNAAPVLLALGLFVTRAAGVW